MNLLLCLKQAKIAKSNRQLVPGLIYLTKVNYLPSQQFGTRGTLLSSHNVNRFSSNSDNSIKPLSSTSITNFPFEQRIRQQSSTSLDVNPRLDDGSTEQDEPLFDQEQQNQHDLHNAMLEKKAILQRRVTKGLSVLTRTYDFLTLPIYALVQQPWKRLSLSSSMKAITIATKDGNTIYTSAIERCPLHKELDEAGVWTMSSLFNYAMEKYQHQKCLGVREIISEEEVIDANTGKPMKKYALGDYSWKTFEQVNETVQNLINGLELLKLPKGEKIAIFAETREEWFCIAMAAFQKNLPIVTVFTTLSDDGVIHALQQTEVSTLVTSEDLIPRVQQVIQQLPSIQKLVYFEKPKKFSTWNSENEPLGRENIEIFKYSQLLEHGAAVGRKQSKAMSNMDSPTPEDVAIIMYTSGSTGVPKGVMISHKNLIEGLKGSLDVTSSVGEIRDDDTYAAYLPLAHIMEFLCESMTFVQGIPIGYSSPLTLTDKSPGVKEGFVGDASLIKPSVLPAVPLVVERICKGIKEKVTESGPIKEILFNYFIDYKISWKRQGYSTPIVDKIFFKKIKDLVGGKLRYLVVGGAPLAPKTQEFISAALCCPVAIGYGMTETASTGSVTLDYDLSVGRVGGPIRCSYFKLVNWEDGGYRITDKPYPRGELYMGGDNVALGYYKRPDCKDFFEEDGKQWIRTGDIAEVHPDGVFKIIDRKKDLVKISTGKFVSLGRIESVLKSSPFVENICIYADSTQDHTVAIVVPVRQQIEKFAKEEGIVWADGNYDSLCRNPLVHEAILNDIQIQGKSLNLHKYEIPQSLIICPEQWLPNSGMVTAAFKIRRTNIYKNYKAEIDSAYRASNILIN